MDSWPKGIAAITLFVEDLKATKTFYQEVFFIDPGGYIWEIAH